MKQVICPLCVSDNVVRKTFENTVITLISAGIAALFTKFCFLSVVLLPLGIIWGIGGWVTDKAQWPWDCKKYNHRFTTGL